MSGAATATSPLRWLPVGELDDIPRQGARTLDQDGTRIAVFRTADDRVFALEDRCPHRGGPLSQGIVHGDCVTCPLHNQVVSLATGDAGEEGVAATRPVRLDGRRVLLGVIADTVSPEAAPSGGVPSESPSSERSSEGDASAAVADTVAPATSAAVSA